MLSPVDVEKLCGGGSLQELVVATLGPSMAVVVSLTILALIFGSLVSYFIITEWW